ncbi:MAG: hypothetical protein M0P73_02045 [Syntrophobacterales bacterium]|jgi:hypothetical protein|nr:hypothetical protein [Syntrophobacterales bacterium]
MAQPRAFFSEVRLDGQPLAAYQQSPANIRDRHVLKDFLEYVHIHQGLLVPYTADYPLIEPRELLPSFEKNFSEYKWLPSFSMVAFNRALSYQEEIFQYDVLHPRVEGKRRPGRGNLEKILPHLDRDLRPIFKQQFGGRDLTDLAHYEELLPFLFHMDRAQVIARDEAGDFRLLGVYASFPSDLDTELKALGCRLGKFKKLDHAVYEREREFVYQFLMELYGFPIASERRTSGALFARRLSRLKEQYLVKVLGASDRTITSLSGFEQKRYPLVEKIALISLPVGVAEASPHLRDAGYYVDPERRVVILKVTYQQHKYNRNNVLEDRALSVVRQELIHPYHGGRETSLNLLKDTKRLLKDLTDIVRGEYIGYITYKRSELLTSTKTHEERLKFLSAWLTKNQRRLGTYSQETFEAAKKLLNSYLAHREYREVFARHRELHREVVHGLTYLNQVQRLQPLEKLAQAEKCQKGLGPSRRLALAVDFLEENREQLPYFYPDLFDKCCQLYDRITYYPYFRKLLTEASPPASSFRRRVWEILVRGRELLADLRRQHDWVAAEAQRGTPFPMLSPDFQRSSAPKRA